MTLLSSAISGVADLLSLAAPEIMFFCLAIAGMAMFGSGMIGPFISRFLVPSSSLTAKKLTEDAPSTPEESAEKQLQAALLGKNHSEAIRIWRDLKFTIQAPGGTLLVELLEALRAVGSSAQAFIIELQQAAERNPEICEGDAMECLFLALGTERAVGETGDTGLWHGLAAALHEVGRLSPKLRCTLIEQVLRREQGDGLDEAMDQLMELPAGTRLPSSLGSRILYLAASKDRLPGVVAALKDAEVAWAEDALEAPMAMASKRGSAELCIQLHRAGANLDIPRSSAECELLLRSLESAPAAMRVVADDIAQNPGLEISPSLGLLLLKAGVDESLTGRVLGRPCSPLPLLAAS